MAQMSLQQALDLAIREHQSGRSREAETICRHILVAQPDQPDALHLLGVIDAQRGLIDSAMDFINRAIAGNPSFAGFHNSLGQILIRAGRAQEAIASFQKAVHLSPDFENAHYNLAMAHQAGSDWPAAIESNRKVLAINPNFAPAENNLGLAFHATGRFDEAIAAYERAISLNPDKALVHYNFAMTLLLTGDLLRGFAEYQWRCREPALRMCRDFPQPLWEGSELAGKRILLHSEQGFGDTMQFVRYLPLVRRRGGQIIILCQPELRQLLSLLPDATRVATPNEPTPMFDVHCPLLNLPEIFKTTLQTIPANVPYLGTIPLRVAQWKDRLSGINVPKVGLVWSGSKQYANDRTRSLTLDMLAPLAAVKDVQFISLQKGEAAKQVRPDGMNLIDYTSDLHDFSDTAALIENLDLVITVDTAVAHLAGAMGKPVWVLLPLVPDWRWMLNRTDSPWYPTMKLLRQQQHGNWSTPVNQLVEALQSNSLTADKHR